MEDSIYLWFNQITDQYCIGHRDEYLADKNIFSSGLITKIYTMLHDEMEIGKKIVQELNCLRQSKIVNS